MPLSSAEISAVIAVLWHTPAIRDFYENRALRDDAIFWKNNGGKFPNFSRYNSKKWADMMGEDDPSVRGRKISATSMARARRDFEEHYWDTIRFALELAEIIRTAVSASIEESGIDDDYDEQEQIGADAWKRLVSDPSIRERVMEISRDWCNVDKATFKFG